MRRERETPTDGGLLAVIPARGGSKRVPGKNLLPFRGEPIIVHTIRAALDSRLFDRVVVSTDSPDIADVSVAAGADVPFLRAADLSDDLTPVSEATADALERVDPAGTRFRAVAQLMANCPLRTSADIRASWACFELGPVPAQLSVTRFGWQNPWWAMRLAADGRLEPVFDHLATRRSQDLPELYCPTGAIWWARAQVLRSEKSYHVAGRTGWEIPWQRGVDIDTPEDWRFAEALAAAEGSHAGE